MHNSTKLADISAASERLFRFYLSHCKAPDRDTLFSVLEAAHSLNDRLKKGADLNFFDFSEFVALKCLRNYFHHHHELRHVVRFIPLGNYPIATDLMTLCLLPYHVVEAAIEKTTGSYRNITRQACLNVFHQYDRVVNINPCLLNFVVLAYERLKSGAIPLTGDAVGQFETSYHYEEQNGLSHFVDGKLVTATGNVSELLADIVATEGLQRIPD